MKKIISILLIATMAVVLAACGSKSGSKASKKISKNLDGELFEEAESKTYSMKSSNISNKMEYDDNMIIK